MATAADAADGGGGATAPPRSRSPRGRSNGEAQEGAGAHGEPDYGADFFEQPLDRGSTFSVKYGLRGPLFGPAAADALPLWVADMDLPCAPEVVAALRRRTKHPAFGYTYQPGDIWQLVQRWLEEEHGWRVAADAFVFCAGVVTAAAAALWAFTKPGDAVLVMTPLYEPLQKAVEGAGREPKRHLLELSGGRYVLDRVRLQRDLKGCTALLLCNPHNPGGRVWLPEELRVVADACRAEGALLLSDEIWADWCLFGHRHRPAALEAAAGQPVVTLMAPTKTWNLAGLHCAFLVIEDASLRQKYLASVAYAFLHYGSTFATEAMLAAYACGKPWLRGAKGYVEAQLLHCEAFLRERCSPEVVPLRPEATYLLWLDCAGLGSEDPARLLREQGGVLLSPGAEFGGAATAHFARLNAAAPRRTLDVALERIAAVVQRRRREGSGAGA